MKKDLDAVQQQNTHLEHQLLAAIERESQLKAELASTRQQALAGLAEDAMRMQREEHHAAEVLELRGALQIAQAELLRVERQSEHERMFRDQQETHLTVRVFPFLLYYRYKLHVDLLVTGSVE